MPAVNILRLTDAELAHVIGALRSYALANDQAAESWDKIAREANGLNPDGTNGSERASRIANSFRSDARAALVLHDRLKRGETSPRRPPMTDTSNPRCGSQGAKICRDEYCPIHGQDIR